MPVIRPTGAGTLGSGHVDGSVLQAAFGLDEAEAFGRIEPFHKAQVMVMFLSSKPPTDCGGLAKLGIES